MSMLLYILSCPQRQDAAFQQYSKQIKESLLRFTGAGRRFEILGRPGNIVIDLFGGSGTTLIASEQTGRRCRMMELDPKYVDVIVKRYINTTGKEDVILLRDGEEISLCDTGILEG